MKKFIEFMENHVIPIAARIGAEPHLASIRDAFVTLLPIIMIGAVGLLVNNITNAKIYVNIMKKIFGAGWQQWGANVYNASYGIMALIICFNVAYFYATTQKKDRVVIGGASVAVFVLFTVNLSKNIVYVGANGLLLAIIVSLVVSHIMCILLGNPKLVIKMPEGVPPAVSKSFASLFPTMIVLGGAGIIQEIYMKFNFGMIMPELFNKIIQTPLQSIVGSLWGFIIMLVVIQLLWFFGLHGMDMMMPVINGVLLPLTLSNMSAIEHGEKAKYILNDQFLNSFCAMGGSGLTIGLLIAFFIMRKKKSAQQKQIAKLAVAPCIFNINEPVIFGLPICLDPIYIFPFILAPIVNAIIAYITMAIGLVPYPTIEVMWTMPPVLSGMLATRSISGGVLSVILIIIDVALYLPFAIVAANRDQKVEESVAEKVIN